MKERKGKHQDIISPSWTVCITDYTWGFLFLFKNVVASFSVLQIFRADMYPLSKLNRCRFCYKALYFSRNMIHQRQFQSQFLNLNQLSIQCILCSNPDMVTCLQGEYFMLISFILLIESQNHILLISNFNSFCLLSLKSPGE